MQAAPSSWMMVSHSSDRADLARARRSAMLAVVGGASPPDRNGQHGLGKEADRTRDTPEEGPRGGQAKGKPWQKAAVQAAVTAAQAWKVESMACCTEVAREHRDLGTEP